MRRIVSISCVVLLVAAFSLLLVGCSSGVPSEAPALTGTVTDIDLDMETQMVKLSVTSSASEKSQVTLTEETMVFGPGGEEARAVDISHQTKIKVWFEDGASKDVASVVQLQK